MLALVLIPLLAVAAAVEPAVDPLEAAWIRAQVQGPAAPDVHAVRAEADAVTVESAGLSLQSFGALEAGGPAPVAGGARRFEFRIPRAAVAAGYPRPSVAGSVVGVFINGTPIYSVLSSVSYEDRNLWHRDMVAAAAVGSQTPLVAALIERRDRHSPIIGYALDGYPIYGPYGWDDQRRVRRMRSSYGLVAKRSDGALAAFPLGTFTEDYQYRPGSGDLDASNGRFAVTPEYPQGTYAYFLSTNDDGVFAYPYLIGPALHGHLDTGLRDGAGSLGRSEDWTAYVRDDELTLSTALDALERVHERLVHVFVVSEGLAEFAHIHPEAVAPGVFRVRHRFARGGHYRLFVDYTPAGGVQRFARFDWNVTGEGAAPEESEQSLQVAFERPRGGVVAGRDVEFRFALRDAATKLAPVDLEPYLGAWAHIVILSEDASEILHVHPNESAGAPTGGDPWQHSHGTVDVAPSEVTTMAGFRKAGRYRMWVQVQRAGRVITTPFWLTVENAAGVAAARPSMADGVIPIKVSERGFEPARIEVRGAVRLGFRREDPQNCAREVVFPSLKLKRQLPVGQPVVVEVPADALQRGELAFTCGMGMYRGAVVAK